MDTVINVRGVEHVVVAGSSEGVEPLSTDLLVWDPPWDKYRRVPEHRTTIVHLDGSRFGEIAHLGMPTWLFTWDCCTSWYTAGRPLRRASYAAVYAHSIKQYQPRAQHYPDEIGPKRRAAKVKHASTFGEKAHDYTPDPRGKMLSDVFRFPRPQLGGGHAKPEHWMRCLIGNWLGEHTRVLDMFGGTGTVAAAAAEIGVPSLTYEVDASKAAAIVARLRSKNANPEREPQG